jgi:hypothetical protein
MNRGHWLEIFLIPASLASFRSQRLPTPNNLSGLCATRTSNKSIEQNSCCKLEPRIALLLTQGWVRKVGGVAPGPPTPLACFLPPQGPRSIGHAALLAQSFTTVND